MSSGEGSKTRTARTNYRRGAQAAAAAGMLMSLAWESPARADDRWALVMDVAPSAAECMTPEQLAAEVREKTGEQLVFRPASTAEHTVEGHLELDQQGLTLVLALRDARGERIGERVFTRPASECTALREAAVLAIAVMMGEDDVLLPDDRPAAPAPAGGRGASAAPAATDAAPSTGPMVQVAPEAAGASASTAASEVAPRPAPPDASGPAAPATAMRAAAPSRPAVPARASPPPAALGVDVFAGSAATLALVPGVAAHATLGLRLEPAALIPFELAAVFLGESAAELGGGSDGHARFAPVYGVLSACPIGSGSRAGRVDGCVGVLGGALFAEAADFTLRNERSMLPLLGIVARVPASLRLAGPLFLRGVVTIGAQLLYTKLDGIDAAGERRVLSETAPVFGSLELCLGATL